MRRFAVFILQNNVLPYYQALHDQLMLYFVTFYFLTWTILQVWTAWASADKCSQWTLKKILEKHLPELLLCFQWIAQSSAFNWYLHGRCVQDSNVSADFRSQAIKFYVIEPLRRCSYVCITVLQWFLFCANFLRICGADLISVSDHTSLILTTQL